jgi:hypothetical protein
MPRLNSIHFLKRLTQHQKSEQRAYSSAKTCSMDRIAEGQRRRGHRWCGFWPCTAPLRVGSRQSTFRVRFVGDCHLYFTAKPMPLLAPVNDHGLRCCIHVACRVADEICWLFGLTNLRRTSTRMRRATPRLWRGPLRGYGLRRESAGQCLADTRGGEQKAQRGQEPIGGTWR